MNRYELDYHAAVCILYAWSCGEIKTGQCKAACKNLNFKIDFRQIDNGNKINAVYIPTGQTVFLEV